MQSIALVLTTKNKETKRHIHTEHKRNIKTVLDNRTIYTLIWYAFYELWPGNGVGPILTVPKSTRAGKHTVPHGLAKLYKACEQLVQILILNGTIHSNASKDVQHSR